MAEPEELILEGAHFATRVARDAWRRYGADVTPRKLELSNVRRRLELFVTALFQRPITIAPMEVPAPRTWLSRIAAPHLAGPIDDPRRSGTDGRQIYLPPSLALEPGDRRRWVLRRDRTAASRRSTRPHSGPHRTSPESEKAIGLYRLLAVQQAARLARGTARRAQLIQSGDTRDWFLLAEAAVIDRWISREVPGLEGALKAARADALAHRTSPPGRQAESGLERQVRALLAADPRVRVLDIPEPTSSAQTLAWAQAATTHATSAGPSRPVPLAWYWGAIVDPSSLITLSRADPAEAPATPPARRPRVADMRRRPRPREAPDDEDDSGAGTWVIRADEPQESVEDPFGLQRPADHDEHADPEGLADSLSELPEARVVRSPEQAREVLRSGEDLRREEAAVVVPARRCGVSYPEWDYRTARYREPGAVVRERAAALGDASWVTSALARYARLTRRVRARFERIRPRPIRLARQTDGSEIDVIAYVEATADMRAGAAIDGRMYVAVRPARCELAVALLVDTSASTDAWVSADRRIVDVEKEALLVVCEALDALGDRYGVFAFSGEGAGDVSVLPLKRFDERVDVSVRRRIAALDADRYTRLGAPVRHLTAALCRQAAPRRLLLILSDGKPNDVDLYEGRYGVEDTRRAVAEARRQGVAVFCLTVDREAPHYAARIFGHAGFAVLRRAEQLPSVLIDVLRQLIRQ